MVRDLKIEMFHVARLVPSARNARTHSPEQVAEIAASIRAFGFNDPVAIDDEWGLIEGHGRVLAAKELGLDLVPGIRLGHLTDAQKRAYMLAHNKIALKAGWDVELLLEELAAIKVEGIDIQITGFSEIDVDRLRTQTSIQTPGGTPLPAQAPGRTPEVNAPKLARKGDVWLLGEHRLVCGDSTDAKAVRVLMQDESASFLFTSPPYKDQRGYKNDRNVTWDTLMAGVFSALPTMTDDAQVLVNLGLVHQDAEWVPYWSGWLETMRRAGWRRFGLYIWDQGDGLPGDWFGRLAPAFELVFHFNRAARKPNKIVECKFGGEITHAHTSGGGLRTADGASAGWTHNARPTQDFKIPDSVIRVTRQKGGIGSGIDHPAVFPVALPEHLILAFTDPGAICYEPFCGSGTSILAAERTGRIMRAMELAPEYVDVAIERFRREHPDREIVLAQGGKRREDVLATRGERSTA